MNFKELLSSGMTEKGFTKSDLANKSGITVRSINYYLKDGRIPRIDTADKLLKALGISLVIGKEEPNEAELKRGPQGCRPDAAADG